MIKRLLEEWPEKKFLGLGLLIFLILCFPSFLELPNREALYFKARYEQEGYWRFIIDFYSMSFNTPFIKEAKLSTFRPLASYTHIFDFTVLKDLPRLWRIHSWLWGCLFIISCYKFFSLLTPNQKLVRLSFLILVCNFRLCPNIFYITARSTVIAGLFSLLSLRYFIIDVLNNPNLSIKNFKKTFFFLILGIFTMEYSLYIIPVILFFIIFARSHLNNKTKILYCSFFLSIFSLWYNLYNFYGYGVKNLFYYISFTESLFFKKALLTIPFHFASIFIPTPIYTFSLFNPHHYQVTHYFFYSTIFIFILLYIYTRHKSENQILFLTSLTLLLSFCLTSAPLEWRNFIFPNIFSAFIISTILLSNKTNNALRSSLIILTFALNPLYGLLLSKKSNLHNKVNTAIFWPPPHIVHKKTGRKFSSHPTFNYSIYGADKIEINFLSSNSLKLRLYSYNILTQLLYKRVYLPHSSFTFKLQVEARDDYVQIDVTSLIPLEEFELKFYNFKKEKWDSYDLKENLVLIPSTLPLSFF